MWETLLPLIITKIIIPEVIAATKANPALDDAGIIAKLSRDVQTLIAGNQAFLDSIRSQAGR